MMGMPTPHVDPSPSRNRTCTGFPGAGEVEADGPVDGPAEAARPACQAPLGEDPPQAASRTSVTPSTATVTADRHNRERLMTATLLRTRRVRQAPAARPPDIRGGPGRLRGRTGPVRLRPSTVFRVVVGPSFTPIASLFLLPAPQLRAAQQGRLDSKIETHPSRLTRTYSMTAVDLDLG